MSDLVSAKLDEIPPVHTLIDAAIRTNKPAHVPLYEIAERCGLVRAGTTTTTPVMSMLRSGAMRLPLDKVTVVADELGIDRRLLFIAQLRDTARGLVVKHDTEAEHKEFAKVWGAIASLLEFTHSEREHPLLLALREVEAEIGHEIKPDDGIVNGFKELLRDQYAL